MSNVINWDDMQHNRKARQMPEGATADIVIFHGVRIQRLTDEAVEQVSVRANRRLPALDNQATATDLK